MIRVKCPHCGVSMDIEAKFVGKQGRCGKCRNIFTVPEVKPPRENPLPFDNPFDTLVEDPFENTREETDFGDNPFAAPTSPAKAAPTAPAPDDPEKTVKSEKAKSVTEENAPAGESTLVESVLPVTVASPPLNVSPPLDSSVLIVGPSDSGKGLPFSQELSDPFATVGMDAPFSDLEEAENPFLMTGTAEKPTKPVPESKEAPKPQAVEIPKASPKVESTPKPLPSKSEPKQPPQTVVSVVKKNGPTEMTKPEVPAKPVAKAKEKEAEAKEVKEIRVVPARIAPARSAANFANHKIEAIEATVVDLPSKGTFLLAGGTFASQGMPTTRVLVKVIGSNGVVGWGEVTPCPTWCYETTETIVSTIRNYLAPAVRGLPAWDVGRVVREMDRVIQPGATIGQPLAKSGIDTALHDMLARTLEVPLHVLLGGKRLDSIWLSYIVSAHDADEAAQQAQKGLELGYTAFKIKVGMNNEAIDRAIVEAVTQVCPKETFLWVDANQGYGLDTALRQAQFFGRLGIQAFEQPLKGARISAFRRLVNLQVVPIALDETLGSAVDLMEHIKAEAVDLPVAKLQRCGGHYHSKEFCTVAESAGLRLMGSGLCETDLGLAHGIQLFSSFGIDLPCDLNGRQFVESSYLSEGLTVQNGRALLPDRPGCGVEVDENKVAHYTRKNE